MEWSTIISLVLTALFAIGLGSQITKMKGFLNQIKEFFVVLTDALNDNTVTKEELKKIVEEAIKLFTFWKPEEKQAVNNSLKNKKKLTF